MTNKELKYNIIEHLEDTDDENLLMIIKTVLENFKNDLMECELNLKMLQINSPVPAL